MHVLDTYVGHRDDEAVAARLAAEGHETASVGATERRRSRFRTETGQGTEVGVVVGRDLRTGDVLAGDGLLVVVELAAVEALVVAFGDADGDGVLAAVELGYAVGNRHWDLAVQDGQVFVALTDARERMEATLRPHLPECAVLSVESVPPTTFDDHGHTRGNGHEHVHDHGGTGGHGHDHSGGDA
jgi:urease accessory protein